MKNYLKLTALALIFICVAVVPFVGVAFGGYNSPSIFEDNVFLTNRQFGNGTEVFLEFVPGSEVEANEENLKKSAEILSARLENMGYPDSVVEVADKKIRVEIAQTSYIDTVFADIASVGKWSFMGPSMSEDLCDATMVKDAYPSMNATGGYGVTLEFTEEGVEAFRSKTASYALTGAYIYLMVDDQFAASATVPLEVEDTFTFGAYNANHASELAATIKYGALPAAMVVASSTSIGPVLPSALLISIAVFFAVIVIASVAFLIVRGKSAGIFASMTILVNVFVILTAMVNRNFMLGFPTLITLLICFILSVCFAWKAIKPAANALANGKALAPIWSGSIMKWSMKGIWIHAALFIVVLLTWLFARGSIIYVILAIMTYTISNFVSYFVFTFFGIHALSELRRN